MFSQATREIYNMKAEIASINSRVTLLISDLRADVESLKSSLEDLITSISQLKAVLEPKADASTENPKEKADLEIFEQNIEERTKDYIDLDLIPEPRYKIGVFDDDNWYNLQ